ncbi:MAG: hypothetical protein HY883_00515 [Deltaproteobacteria bacterium]|nr:hypothetical protein [Deltaproteobacteria bacterium]
MKAKTLAMAFFISLALGGYVVAAEMGAEKTGMEKMTEPHGPRDGHGLMPPEKVEAMKKAMMEMQPDTLDASIKRGEGLFNDTTLGNNATGTSCSTCHPKGGTIGGAAEMEWKGMAMKAAIPTLIGAAAGFPKPIGPMKAVSTVGGQNNICIMTFLKGAPLDLNSQEAVDLEAYVYSLSKGRRIDMGAKKKLPKPVPGAM